MEDSEVFVSCFLRFLFRFFYKVVGFLESGTCWIIFYVLSDF